MGVIFLIFPKTTAGRDTLRQSIAVNGVRDVYPDGSTLREIDWDEIAAFAEADFPHLPNSGAD